MEETLDFTVRIEKKHIYDYVLYHTYGKFRGKMFVAIGLIALILLVLLWKDYEVFQRFALIFVAAYYLVAQPFLTIRKAKKLASMPNFYVPIHYVFGPEEIQVTQGEEEVTYRWEDGILFVSRKREIFMYVSLREAYMIPKDQVADYVKVLSMATEHSCPVRAS